MHETASTARKPHRAICPVCQRPIYLHTRPVADKTLRPARRVAAKAAPVVTLGDLLPLDKGRRAARAVTPSAVGRILTGIGVVAAMALLPGCSSLPVDALEYRSDGNSHGVRVELARPVQLPCNATGGYAK